MFGHQWCAGLDYDRYTHHLPPNGPNCLPADGWTPAVTASSGHAAGAHAVFMDGSSRFIPEQIERLVWHALGTRGTDVTFDAD